MVTASGRPMSRTNAYNYRLGRKCSKCGKLIADNGKTGVCRECMAQMSNEERMALGTRPFGRKVRARPVIEIQSLPAIASLPDAYLAQCVAEAWRRSDAIVTEAQTRAAKLRRVLDGKAPEVVPVNGVNCGAVETQASA